MLLLISPAIAQDDAPIEPVPTDEPVIIAVEPSEVEPIAPEDTSTVISFERLLLILSESVAGSMLLAVLVNAIKVLDPNVNAQQVTFIGGLVIIAFIWGARAIGQVALLESVFGWLSIAIPAGMNFLMLLLGAPAVYHAGKALNVPVLGYSPVKAATVYDARHAEG